jgi:uncharacterized membrane protein
MDRPDENTNRLARAALIAGVYVVTTWALAPISFGPLQLRLSEALTLLPILYPEAIPALFIGAMVANIFSPLGLVDILGGSIVTLIAAYMTRRFRRSHLAYLSPVLLNSLLVSIYLHPVFGWTYGMTALSIGISEAIVVYALGLPLIRFLREKGHASSDDGR